MMYKYTFWRFNVTLYSMVLCHAGNFLFARERWLGMKKTQLDKLYDRVAACNCGCPGERRGAGRVRDTGNPDNGIILVGEAPGGEEIKLGVPFVGQAGTHLEGFLSLAGLSRRDVFIINSVKCRPTKNNGRANRNPGICEIKSCARWLDEELGILSPWLIIPLGGVALKKFFGNRTKIGDCHGKPVESNGYTVFPMYHPASVIYRPQLQEIIEQDFINLGKWLRQNAV